MSAAEAFGMHRPELRRLAREGCPVAAAELARRDARRAAKRNARLNAGQRAHYVQSAEREALCPGGCGSEAGVVEDEHGVMHAAYCDACADAVAVQCAA